MRHEGDSWRLPTPRLMTQIAAKVRLSPPCRGLDFPVVTTLEPVLILNRVGLHERYA